MTQSLKDKIEKFRKPLKELDKAFLETRLECFRGGIESGFFVKCFKVISATGVGLTLHGITTNNEYTTAMGLGCLGYSAIYGGIYYGVVHGDKLKKYFTKNDK